MEYKMCEEEFTALQQLLSLLEEMIKEILLFLETIIKK